MVKHWYRDKPFLYTFSIDVVEILLKEFYDYLPEKAEFVKEAVKKEEVAFHKTLSQGEKKIKDVIAHSDNK